MERQSLLRRQRADKKLQELYDYIVKFKAEHDGNSPTERQIMAALNISSTSVVHYRLAALEDDGRIRRNGGRGQGVSIPGARWLPPSGD